MRLTSGAFGEGEGIPKRHTEDGEDLSPPLAWTDAPEETAQFALVVDDPDAPTDEPWVHWLIYRIPGTVRELGEGVPRDESPADPAGAAQGTTSFDQNNLGYGGPAPPPGHGTHHYHFKLYALSRPLDLGPRADKAAVLEAVRSAGVLAETELVGTYER